VHDLWPQLRGTPGAKVSIDLPAQVLVAPDGTGHAFEISALRKDRLVHGIDDIDATLAYEDAIESFERARRAAFPWLPMARRG
jgi:3-isopropylmalate/(R)-2-methylmalate dehydratase small subunit